ncbi:MAG TPA: hypothetical protein VG826_29630 [Pirellulales bacterium]|nr:hypothetical protein [Pirellulales bacterium]
MEPTPADRACPTCGHRSALDVCPECGRDNANPFVSPAIESLDRGDEWRWIAAVALGVCVLSGALAFVSPGLAVLLLVLASPVLARTWAVVERRREAGLPISAAERVQAIVMSGAMLLLASLAGAIACAVVCVPLGLAVFMRPQPSYDGMIVAFAASVLAALVAGVYVMRRYWPKRIAKVD